MSVLLAVMVSKIFPKNFVGGVFTFPHHLGRQKYLRPVPLKAFLLHKSLINFMKNDKLLRSLSPSQAINFAKVLAKLEKKKFLSPPNIACFIES